MNFTERYIFLVGGAKIGALADTDYYDIDKQIWS